MALELPSSQQPKPTPARGRPQVLPGAAHDREGDLFPRPNLTKAGTPQKVCSPRWIRSQEQQEGTKSTDSDLTCLTEGTGKDLFGERGGGGGGLKLSLGKGEESSFP